MNTKILIRPENFLLRYQHWKEKDRNLHIEMLRGSYANEVFGKGSSDLKYEQSNRYSRIIWTPEEVRIEALGFLLEDLKNVLLKNNFTLQISDERNEIYDSGLKVTVHRQYLKTSESDDEDRTGTIVLEHSFSRMFNAITITSICGEGQAGLAFEKLMETLMS